MKFPEAIIRLERPIQSRLGLLHLDVVAEFASRIHAFELKYKTRATATRLGSEAFMLQDHGAQPLGRYDFVKDVHRLESLEEELPGAACYAILLTNDSAYWSEARSADDTSAAFSLCDARTLSGRLDWSARASAGTKRKREQAIELRCEYLLNWRDYSSIEAKYYPRFRYLALQVAHPAVAA